MSKVDNFYRVTDDEFRSRCWSYYREFPLAVWQVRCHGAYMVERFKDSDPERANYERRLMEFFGTTGDEPWLDEYEGFTDEAHFLLEEGGKRMRAAQKALKHVREAYERSERANAAKVTTRLTLVSTVRGHAVHDDGTPVV